MTRQAHFVIIQRVVQHQCAPTPGVGAVRATGGSGEEPRLGGHHWLRAADAQYVLQFRPVRVTAGLALVASMMTMGVSVGLAAPDAAAELAAPAAHALSGRPLYVDPESSAARAARAEPDPQRVELLRKIAARPVALWLGDWVATQQVRQMVVKRVQDSAAVGAVPLFVLYAVPNRDCGSYSSGGMATAAAYRAWIEEVAQGLAVTQATAAVILEPDALAQLDCLGSQASRERVQMLRDAVLRLSQLRTVSVYVDAGNAGWKPASTMAQRLRDVGVTKIRGFSLNVSNFGFTADEVAYGKAIVRSLRRTSHFLVDTGRNGLGRATGEFAWCNPSGRALGVPPQSPSPDALVDAVVWAKPPGNSDGACRADEPSAGAFWPEYAVGLASRATW
jgi:endoglucanase